MNNISNMLSGFGGIASGIASGYKDPSIGIEIFLKQKQLENQQAYNQMRIDSTLWSKGFEKVTDENETKTLLKNQKHNPTANKGVFALNGAFYKYNPKLSTDGIKNFEEVKKSLSEKFPELKGSWIPSSVKVGDTYLRYQPSQEEKPTKAGSSPINGAIATGEKYSQYKMAVQNAIAKGVSLQEIKSGIEGGGFSLKDFSDIVVPYAGGMSNTPPLTTKQLFMQNLGNMFSNVVSRTKPMKAII